MIIAIPVDENNVNSTVCFSYGRAPFFQIYNSDTKESTFLDNSAIASTGGAGIKASQVIADADVEVLLTQRCGENAAEVLNGADIKIYKTQFELAQENINAFLEGKLAILDEIHAGFHMHGGK